MKEYIENGIRYGMLEEGDLISKGYQVKQPDGDWTEGQISIGLKWMSGLKLMRIRLEEPKDEPRCTWCGNKDVRSGYGCEHYLSEHEQCGQKLYMCNECSRSWEHERRFYCSEHVHLYRDNPEKCKDCHGAGLRNMEPKPINCIMCDHDGNDKEPPKPEEKDAGTKALESVLDKVDKMTPEEYREEYDKIKDMPDAPEAILDYTPQAAIVRGAPPSQAFGSIQCFKASEEELMARDKRDLFNKATGEDGR